MRDNEASAGLYLKNETDGKIIPDVQITVSKNELQKQYECLVSSQQIILQCLNESCPETLKGRLWEQHLFNEEKKLDEALARLRKLLQV